MTPDVQTLLCLFSLLWRFSAEIILSLTWTKCDTLSFLLRVFWQRIVLFTWTEAFLITGTNSSSSIKRTERLRACASLFHAHTHTHALSQHKTWHCTRRRLTRPILVPTGVQQNVLRDWFLYEGTAPQNVCITTKWNIAATQVIPFIKGTKNGHDASQHKLTCGLQTNWGGYAFVSALHIIVI